MARTPVLHAVEQMVQTLGDRSAATFVVGLSGGADSVCLLHALAHIAARRSWHLHAAHLDHGLRADAVEDAMAAARLAARLSVPFHLQRLPAGFLQAQPGNLEENARRARYTFLCGLAARLTPPDQQPLVLVAHHANDQAETVLMNLVRGSSMRGLGGMRPIMECPFALRQTLHPRPVQIVRPLLHIERAQILRYLRGHGLTWREDSSNVDISFVRNRLRHEIVPRLQEINPNLVQTLARTARLLADETDRAEQDHRACLQRICLCEHETAKEPQSPDAKTRPRIVLDLQALLALEPASRRGVLRLAIQALSPDEREIDFDAIERILAQLHAEPGASGAHPIHGALSWSTAGATAETPARVSIHRTDALPFPPTHPYLDATWRTQQRKEPIHPGDALHLPDHWVLHADEWPRSRLPAHWRTNSDGWVAYLDAATVEMPTLTTPRAGMRFAPLGLGGRQKQLGDLFTDRKVPASLRSGWPVIMDAASDTVVWVCGVQVGHVARITDTTERVLRLRWARQTPCEEADAP